MFWTPRILCIIYILFLGLFALDVFSEDHTFWETFIGLFMHLIPNFALIIILIITWRWEWVGGILFIALGIAYLVLIWDRFYWASFAGISGPLFVTGILFLVNWKYKDEIRGKKPEIGDLTNRS